MHYHGTSRHLLKSAAYAALAVSSTLIIVKFFAWYITNSISIEATLVDSTLDALVSFVNYLAIQHSLKPADATHSFGHGKIEALAGVGQSVFISFTGIFILKEAFHRLTSPEPISGTGIGILVMIFSIILTFWLVRYQTKVIKKTQSTAVAGDSLHYKSDLLINLSVIFSLLLSKVGGFVYFDTLCGSIITLYILYTAYKIAKEALNILLDKELNEKERNAILSIVRSHKEIHDVHDLRTRSLGHIHFIQMHVEMNPSFTLTKAHKISEEIENMILKEIPNAEIIIHQETPSKHEHKPCKA